MFTAKRLISNLLARLIPVVLVFVASVFAISAVYTYTRADAQPRAYAATSSNLNFQARLLNAAGNTVPDGYYHVEFKLYDAASGGVAEWTETRTSTDRVRVVNGYMSVALGEISAFPPTINWDQDHWLTMNVGGSAASPTWDGEMTPRLKLTAVPYAFQSKQAEMLNKAQGGFTGVLDFINLTANRNITLPDQDGMVVVQSGACTNGQMLRWNATDSQWECVSGNGTSFAVNASDGSTTTTASGLEFGPDVDSEDEFIISDEGGGVTRIRLGNTVLTTNNFAAALDASYVNTNESPAVGDISGSFASGLTIGADAVALGTDTTGDYITSLGALTGLSVIGNSGEGSTPALSVLYGATANTAVQGNTQITLTAGTGLTGGDTITLGAGGTATFHVTYGATANTAVQGNTQLVCAAGTGDLSGGGNTITLGAGGTCGDITISENPVFDTSVTTPLLTNGGALTLQTTATGGADDIIFQTASTEVLRLLENGNMFFERGTNDATIVVATPSGAPATYTFSGATGTVLTTANFAASLDAGYVNINESPAAGDISGSFQSGFTINANSVALGTDTTGDYVQALGALTGLTTSGNGGEGSTPTLSVTYGSLANTSVQGNTQLTVAAGTGLSGGSTIVLGSGGTATLQVVYGSTAGTAVQGNTQLVCASGAGDLSGGGNTITLGAGGNCNNITISESPVFDTSVTTPLLTSVGAITIQAQGTAGADDIIFQTAGTEKLRILENGTLTFGTGANNANLYLSANNTLRTDDLFVAGLGLNVLTGDLNVLAGNIQTNSVNRIMNNGDLVNIGNLTASGALTIANAGAGNDITINSINQVIINAGTTIELQDNTNVTGNVDVSGTFTAGANNSLTIDSDGDILAAFIQLDGTSTANGGSGLGSSTTLNVNGGVGTGGAGFNVGNYVLVNGTYAKITARTTNQMTISPALTWTSGQTVTEYHIPELGGGNTTSTLANRFGRGYFISGVATGNGTTYYNEDGITTSLDTFNLLNENVTNLNIGGAATNITLGSASTNVSLVGNLQLGGTQILNQSGALTNIASLTGSGALSITSGGSGDLTLDSASGRLVIASNDTTLQRTAAGAYTIDLIDGSATTLQLNNSGAGAASLNLNDGDLQIAGTVVLTNARVLQNLTGLTVSSGGASIAGGLSITGAPLNLNGQGITNAGAIAGATTINASGVVTSVGVNAGSGSIQGTGGLNVSGGSTLTGTLGGVTNLTLSGSISGGTTLSLSGAISGATSTNTINGLVINSGSLSSITGFAQNSGAFSYNNASGSFSIDSSAFDVNASGAVSGVTSLSLSGAISGGTTLGLSGAITAATSTNTINGLVINSGALSSITGFNQASGNFSFTGGGNLTITSSGLNVTSAGAISGVTSLSLSGAISGGTTLGLSGAITAATSTNTINGLVINSGSLSSISGYSQASGNFSLTGGGSLTITSSAFSVTSAGAVSGVTSLSMNGALSGVSSLGLSGAISAATSTNTINGLVINSGALSSISGFSQASGAFNYNVASGNFSINSSAFDVDTAGAVSGVTSLTLSGAISGGTSLGLSGAITAATTSNTINGLVINSGALSSISGFNQASGAFSYNVAAGSFSINSSAFKVNSSGAISGVTSLALSGAISGATATDTINGLIINAGALSGITGYGQTTGAFSYNVAAGSFSINSSAFKVNSSGAVSGVTSLALSGAISGATATDTINGLIINGGSLSGITGYSQTSGGFTYNNASGSLAITSSAFRVNSTGAISGVTTLGLSGAITGATATNTINGLVINSGALSLITGYSQTTGTFSFTGGGALTITSSALTVSSTGAIGGVTTLGLSGAITGATTVNTINGLIINSGTLSNVNGITFGTGALNMNNNSITNVGANITGQGAVTIASTTGALTLTSGSGTIVLGSNAIQRSNASLDIDVATAGTSVVNIINSNGSNVANLDVSGALAVGTNNALTIDNDGDLLGTMIQLNGTSTANGGSGLGTSTTLNVNGGVGTGGAGFDVGNYIQVNGTYAKITARTNNQLTITPALTWTSGQTVNEYHIPEIGGNNLTSTLANRFGRGYFITGVATGNGTTYYNEDGISTNLTSYNLLNDASLTSLNIGSTSTVVNILGGLNLGGLQRLSNTGDLMNINSIGGTVGGALTITSGLAQGLTLESGTNGTITIGGDTGVESINIGTGNGAKTMTFGNTAALSTFDFNSGAIITNAFDIVANSVTTADALHITSNGLTTGSGLSINSSSAALTGNLAEINFTGNNALNTGTAFKISSNGALNTGPGMVISYGGTGYALRINDDGTDTDSTPFSINASGQVGVGTLLQDDALQVNGTIDATAFKVNNVAGVSRTCATNQFVNGMTITNGIVTATGGCTTPTLGSDSRLKKDIVSVDSMLDRIMQVNTVNFDFDCTVDYFSEHGMYCDPAKQAGVIAQELKEIFPELVTTDELGYHHVNYQGLSSYTLKAVSEIGQYVSATGNGNFNSLKVNGVLEAGTIRAANIEGLDYLGRVDEIENKTNSLEQRLAAVENNQSQNVDLSNLAVGNFTANGNATVQDLTVNLDLIARGAMVVEGEATFKEIAKFKKDVLFEGQINVLGYANVQGLTVNLDLIVKGAMIVDGNATFKEAVRFEKDVVFEKDVAVKGQATFSSDTAGLVTVKQGETTAKVTFSKKQLAKPVISLTLGEGKFAQYSYRNVTDESFEVILPAPATEDLTFSWVALQAAQVGAVAP